MITQHDEEEIYEMEIEEAFHKLMHNNVVAVLAYDTATKSFRMNHELGLKAICIALGELVERTPAKR